MRWVVGGCHLGVKCDRSDMDPIVGMRFHLRGQNYDLCEAEFLKVLQLISDYFSRKIPNMFSLLPLPMNADSTILLNRLLNIHSFILF